MPIATRSLATNKLINLLLCTVLLAMSGYATANPCHVTATALGGGDGTGWDGTAPMTLQEALGTAACTEVWVKAGVYTPGTSENDSFLIAPNVAVYGGFAGTELQRAQRDPAINLTILSGDIDGDDLNTDGNHVDEASGNIVGTNSQNVVRMYDETGVQYSASTRIDGITITGGILGASKGGGGLLCVADGADSQCSPTLHDVTFSGNYGNYGGAVVIIALNGGVSSPVFSNVTFHGNTASDGGGALYIKGLGGTCHPVFYNVTFADNGGVQPITVVMLGGALYIKNAMAELYNVTFSGNHAYGGGAILAWDANLALQDSILWGNTAVNAFAQMDIAAGGLVVFEHSVIQDAFPGGTWDTSLGIDGGSNTQGDPQLGALEDHGGSTATILLGAGSSAIDTGSDRCLSYSLLSRDQRGMARPQGARCDIGAVEMPYAVNLTIGNVNGWGSVSAAATPSPLNGAISNCTGTHNCSANYAQHSMVQLTATPDPFALFVGWGGDCSGTDIHFNVQLNSAKSCNAIFSPQAALVVAIDDGHKYAKVGDWLTYVISISNYQDTQVNALTITDTLPPQLNAATATWYCIPDNENSTCAYNGGTGNLQDTSMLPGYSSDTYVINAQVLGGGDGRIKNTVAVSGNNGTLTAHDTTTIVIFRNGFDGGDGTQ